MKHINIEKWKAIGKKIVSKETWKSLFSKVCNKETWKKAFSKENLKSKWEAVKKWNWKKIGKNTVNVFLWAFLAFALVITVVALSSTSNGDRLPNIGGYSLITVSSGSMEPEFKEGDLIFVRTLTEEEKINLKEGDVIMFVDTDLSNGTDLAFTTHRIVQVVTDAYGNVTSFGTKGDAVDHVDGTYRQITDVRGIYEGKRMGGIGNALAFLRSRVGFLLFIILPLLVFFAYQVYVVVKYILEMKNKDKKVITKADEEEIKRRAIEEYIRQQAAAQAQQPENPTDSSADSSDKTE